MSSRRRLIKKTCCVTGYSIIALSVAACGGGGAGSGGSGWVKFPTHDYSIVSPTAPIAPNAYNRPLFQTNSAAAREAGFTGEGIIIGVVDSGISTSNPILQDRVIGSFSYVDPNTNNTAIEDVRGHGSKVAQILAGNRIDPFSGGVAPNASLISSRIISDTATSGGTLGYSLAQVNNDLANAGAKIINNSWKYDDWDLANTSITASLMVAYHNFVNVHGGLVVFSSGNDAQANPSYIASLPTISGFDLLEQGWLVVSAVDTNNPNQLAYYANACGISMNYCLVAPGTVSVVEQNSTTGELSIGQASGTSFAAPQVSGAAALVWEAFPYFTHDLVRQTLLGTATDLGEPGVDPVFGYGLLNTAAAVKGPAKFDWGDVSVSFDGYTSTWRNPISGAGGLEKAGSGTLIFTEDVSYEGVTKVFGGTLASEKRIASDIYVGQSGTIDVRNVGGDVTSQGRIVLRNGPTQFNGDFWQTAEGQLALVLGSTLNVAGSAIIDGGDLHVSAIPQGYVSSTQRQNVLNAQNGLSGTFDSFTQDASVFLTATVNYDQNQVWLDIERLRATDVHGVNYNAAALSGATRLEHAFSQLDRQIASQTAATNQSDAFLAAAAGLQQASSVQAAQASLESLSGQLPAATNVMAMQAINVHQRQVSDHIAQLIDTPQNTRWNSAIRYQTSLNRSGFSGVNFQMNGWSMGQDIFLDSSTFIGSALMRSETSSSLHRGAENSAGLVGEAALYGGKLFDESYVFGRIASGYYDSRQKRSLWMGNQSASVTSDQRGSYFNLGSEAGYRLTLPRFQLTPYVDMQYIGLKQDAFRENGASGFGLQANAQTTTHWQAGLGLRSQYGWDWQHFGKLNLTAQAHYQRALAQDNAQYRASFTGMEYYLPLDGITLARDVMRISSGLSWSANDSVQLSINYEQFLSDNQRSTSLNAGLSIDF